jgi:hypothetical protein
MFNLSIQATIYLIVLILTSIINIICISIAAGPLGFLAYTLYAILAIPFFILYVYNVDCLTTGDCQIWSWVVAIFSSISLLITAVVAIYLTAVPPKTTAIFTTVAPATPATPAVPVVPATPATPVVPVVPATPATPASTAGLTDAQYNRQIDEGIQRDDKDFYEQRLRKQQYISLQFVKPNLTPEEKNELWRLQLEIEYADMINDRKNSQKYLLNARGLVPELREMYQTNLMILQRSIEQREKMTIVYPPLLELNSLQIESIKLKLKLVIELKPIIQQELLKPGLSNDEIRALQQQLVALESKVTLYNYQLNKK